MSLKSPRRGSTPAEPAAPGARAADAARRAGFALLVSGLFFAVAVRLVHPPYDGPRALLDPGYRVPVNGADAETLRLLHGVGPALAENIVSYREQHGPFHDALDLEEVPRIGPATRQRIERWVRFDVSPAPAPQPATR